MSRMPGGRAYILPGAKRLVANSNPPDLHSPREHVPGNVVLDPVCGRFLVRGYRGKILHMG